MRKGPPVLPGCGLVEALRGPQVGCVGVVHEAGQVKTWWGSTPGYRPGSQDKAEEDV